MSKRKAEVLM
jgi:superfamily I DNA and/or RNA helicase